MKKIFALAVAGLMAVAAKADYSGTSTYFYWNVGSTDASISGFSYATLLYSVVGSGSWTAAGVGDLTYGGSPATKVGGNKDGTTASVFGNLGATELDNTYSFMAAVYNDSGDKIGESKAVAYDAQSMFKHLYTNMGRTPTEADVFSFTVAAVPEPTSGLLLLLGVAGLALKRKRT